MPDLSSLILQAPDIHLAPSHSPQCGASVSGDHTTAPQLPSSSRIQHQIHVFGLPTNCVWQMGSWPGREGGWSPLCSPEQGLWRGSHPPSPTGRHMSPAAASCYRLFPRWSQAPQSLSKQSKSEL